MSRIYISSTYSDLKEARGAVAGALRKLTYDVVAMEDYSASDERPLDRCLADVAACDIYVGILAWRYGYVPPGRTKSITELEFREADRLQRPTLFFLLHEDAPWPRSKIDRDHLPIEALRAEVSRDFLVGFFETTDQLSALVATAVTKIEGKRTSRAAATHYLRTPKLGLEVWQDGTRNPLLRADAGVIRVPMTQAPFELRIPDVGEEDHVKIASSFDKSIFAQVEGTALRENITFFRPGTGMADTVYGSGQLWLSDEAHMYLNWGGRLMPRDQGGGVVLFHSVQGAGGDGLPRDQDVHLIVHVVQKGSVQVTPYNTERLILQF
jgi:hypothetical protein